MVGRLNIRDNLRDDERRRRDEARLIALEEGLDELRAQRAEIQAVNGARQGDETRLRAALDELEARLAGLTAPIPNLEARLTELANQMRAKLQELTSDQGRFDDLQAQIDRLPPQIARSADVARDLRDGLTALKGEIEAVRADVQRVSDTAGMVEQDVRRRTSDAVGRLAEVNARIDGLRDELPPLGVQIDRVRHELHGALPRFDTLEAADRELKEEVDRNAVLSFDRHVQALARVDEGRAALEERIKIVERLNDTRFGATMARFTEMEEADRGLAHRITLLAVRLDELREQDAAIRAEMRRLEELRVRVRLEQAQQEAVAFRERLRELQAEVEAMGGDGA